MEGVDATLPDSQDMYSIWDPPHKTWKLTAQEMQTTHATLVKAIARVLHVIAFTV